MLDVVLTLTRAIYKAPIGDFDLVAKYGYQHLEEEAHFDTDIYLYQNELLLQGADNRISQLNQSPQSELCR